MRIAGLICGYVAVVLAIAVRLLGFGMSAGFAISVFLILGVIFLHLRKRPVAIVMWSIGIALTLLLGLMMSGPGVVLLAAEVVALIASISTSREVAALQKAARAEASAAAAHAQRVAVITQWEAAYRDSHNGENPPPGAISMVPQSASSATNTMSVLALVFGIIGGPLGVVFGHIALSQIKKTGEGGRGMAIAGLVLGYAGIAVALGAFAIGIANS